YGFEVGKYDRNCELIIDPVILAYSTYLGGGDYESGDAIAVDSNGNAYVTGFTRSTDFPILNEFQADQPDYDVFVTKIDTTKGGAASLVYSTYLGGSSNDSAYGIAVDEEGNAYVTGGTHSADFPILNQIQADQPYKDAFVTKLDTTKSGDASLVYSTYLGGEDYDGGRGIAVDSSGYVYVSGSTYGAGFPILNQFQEDPGVEDAFVTKIDTTQSGASCLIYSTYLGGSDTDYGQGIAVDGSGNAYVTGFTYSTDFPILNQYQSDPDYGDSDAFVTRIDTTQSGDASLIYSTYLGGLYRDACGKIAVDTSGYTYVIGNSSGPDFPTLNPYQSTHRGGTWDLIVTKLDTNQSGAASLIYSTYLGGSGDDRPAGIAVDSSGNVYVTGYTLSTDFPCLNEFQTYQGGYSDAIAARIDTTRSGAASLIYSTCLGGTSSDYGHGIALDPNANAYLTGSTSSQDFPTVNPYQTYQAGDAFVTKLTFIAPPTVITTPVSSITTTSASGGGEVTSDGGAEVIARGVCWSTSQNPTTDDSHTVDGNGTGVFTSSLTNLTPNTVYYVRAYAVNSVGTAYGNEETFETDDPSITVTYPNGGETLVVGSGMNITWTSDAVEGNVKIEYSADNGGYWTVIIASTENDGMHPCTVPAAPSYQCLIRVSETDGSPADTSDSVFTIAVSANAIPLIEREALIALYNSTDGDYWLARTNWKKPDGSFNDPGTEYTWYGITVENNHVKEIDLSYNELGGTIPSEIGDLSQLTKLDLKQDGSPQSYDPISGPIPTTIGSLGQLRYLDFSGNDFNGNIPTEIGNLTNLEYLNLDNNELTGSIPSSLGNLVNLQTLRILDNQLSGSIPGSLTNLVNLRYLDLGSNDLGGNIPSEIGNLTLLEYLSLRANALSGGIPSGLGNLVNLNTLWLRGNKLIGSIPTGLTNLTGLSDTDIGYNALYTDDDTLVAFLNQKDPDWESTQTIAPSDVSASVLSNNSIEVSWTPITYTAGEGGYRVFYSTTQGGPYTFFGMTVDKTVSSMIVTGLNSGTPYYFVVQTRSQPGVFNGNTLDSEYSNEVSDTTYFAITVTSPNGGEQWQMGSQQTITWSSEGGGGNVMIEYSINGDRTWKKITASTENDGSYNWLIPNQPSDNCLIRVSGNDVDEGSSDTSDNVFSIVSLVPGSIIVRSPNGGESWTAGSSQEIKWNSTGDINHVTIKYSTDNGTTWKTITQNTSNDGSFNWTVPDTVSDKCLVRVTANDGSSDPRPSDVSDGVFSIVLPSSPPTITVIAPNGGEQLIVGSSIHITWLALNMEEPRIDVKIEYSVNGGQDWTIITEAVDNNGDYDWIVPDTPSDNCLVRIGEIDGQPEDVSDAVFTIVSPSPGAITVTSPNGGETWEADSSYEIKWTSTGIDFVTIDYSPDYGTTWKTIVQATPNSGSFDWTTPDTASEECLVRITSNDGGSDPRPSDVSDSVFSIVLPPSPTITVTAPNGGEQLIVGSSINITWLAVNMEEPRKDVKIEYSVNSGQDWTIITEAVDNNGDYDWLVPDTPSETCLVRISEIDGQPLDVSDAVFSIVQPVPGEITVTSPNGGETWTVGSTQEIKWTGSGIDSVTIEYSQDYGTTWKTIVQTTANNGSFDWTIPDTVSDQCLVQVRATDDDLDPKPSDVSDDVFSIVSSSDSFKVTSPNGGETWEVGSVHAITWTGTGTINTVMIDYSFDNGSTWSTIVSSTVNNGTYDWPIPDTVSEECLVRVTASDGAGDPKPSDVSDEVFSIVHPSSPTITVLTPNGGEELPIGSRYSITWYATDPREEVKIEYTINGGDSWTEITGSIFDGDFDWLVPDEPSETCLVRISEIDGQPVDVSDAVFSIVQPQTGDLTVLTPNGGENLETGSEYNISWTCSGLNNVIIEYSVNSGGTWLYIDKVPADNGNYTWTVPGTPSDNCLVRVTGADSDENPSDVSDGVFTISDPSQAFIEVFTPNGGESLAVGEEYYITWTSAGVNSVIIEYSVDNGNEWITIDTVSAIGGRYNWTVPDTPSDSCLIRISGNTPGEPPFDVSDEVFTISN
nr:hypothetical protein [Candidatus Aminicenantes bacterium]NIQ68369.1 hypothetical protein [Candidatus Aminicenantes bacterium]NIT24412.1 hypothetical protein [Candidatus Aminicenantes bacterium]